MLHWCENGFGPLAPNGDALTSCFVASVLDLPPAILFLLFCAPELFKTIKLPLVNPASSWTFALKMVLSGLSLICSVLTGASQPRISASVGMAQAALAVAWLFSIILLVAGHIRAEPQPLGLKIWWQSQCVFSLISLVNSYLSHAHTLIKASRILNFICVTLLGFLSVSHPKDVPRYVSLSLDDSHRQALDSPLLSSSSPSAISRRSIYGAHGSEYLATITAWAHALGETRNSFDELPKPNGIREERREEEGTDQGDSDEESADASG